MLEQGAVDGQTGWADGVDVDPLQSRQFNRDMLVRVAMALAVYDRREQPGSRGKRCVERRVSLCHKADDRLGLRLDG